MKTTVISLSTLFLFCSVSGIAQIFPPVQPDVPITGTVVNTGLSVAPAINHYAVVYDDPSATNYSINWLDASGAIVDAHSYPGTDPDVAYFRNADLVFVGYAQGGDVYIDEYQLLTLSPSADYNLSVTNGVASGSRPNIDCNSSGRGVFTWQSGGNVYACSFYPGLIIGPPTLIATGAQNPDIVLKDNTMEAVITYTTSSGDLHIEEYKYSDLTTGTASMVNQWIYNGSGPNVFSNPRIAAERNANFGSLKNFTVVSEYFQSPSTNYIVGFFYDNGSMNPTLVNNGVQNCDNSRPVVTYERYMVHVAWASNASPGCATVPGGIGDNILIKEHKFNGADLTPGQFREVNSWSNGFVDGSPSISAEYDGAYSINNSNYHEAIVYNDWGDLFWKARNTSTPAFFKQASEEEIESVSNFQLLENPVKDFIYVSVKNNLESTFTLYDNLGKRVMVNTISNTGEYYQIDINHLPKGIYFLECHSGNISETIKVIN